MRIMVMMLDPEGLPRAWGVAPSYEPALRMATEQLEVYKAKKREVDDPLGWATFTAKTETVEP